MRFKSLAIGLSLLLASLLLVSSLLVACGPEGGPALITPQESTPERGPAPPPPEPKGPGKDLASISVDKKVKVEDGTTWVEQVEQNVCQNVEFQIIVTHDAVVPLYNIVITDHLPDCFEYIPGSASPTPDSTAPYIWNFPGPVQPGDTIEITFSAHVVESGGCKNPVSVDGAYNGDILHDEDVAYVTGITVEELTENAYLLEQNSDGSILYTVITSGMPYQLSKSTDDGYTWQDCVGAPTGDYIVAIATSPTDAYVVYFATVTTVYKSVNAGATFGALPAAPTGHTITTLDVDTLGGDNIVVIGTALTDMGDVFIYDEGSFPPTWQNQGFSAAMVAAYPVAYYFDRVFVAFAPDFSTSQAVVAVGNDIATSTTLASVMSGGGWGGAIGNQSVPIIGSTAKLGDIAFPDDWNADPTTGNSNFFFGLNDTDVGIDDASGVYLFQGEPAPTLSDITNVSGPAQVVTLDADGPFSSAFILAGLTNGTVIRSEDSGSNWLSVSVQPTGSDYTYVVLALDFITSSTNLYGVWGSSSSDVYAVGQYGTIVHYDGTAWSPMTSGTTNPLYGIWGSSSSDVHAVGWSGTILHYDGTAWSLMSSGVNTTHKAWALVRGTAGGLSLTTDAGANWTLIWN